MKALYQKKKTQSYSSAGFTMGTEYLLDYFLTPSNSKPVFLKTLEVKIVKYLVFLV